MNDVFLFGLQQGFRLWQTHRQLIRFIVETDSQQPELVPVDTRTNAYLIDNPAIDGFFYGVTVAVLCRRNTALIKRK